MVQMSPNVRDQLKKLGKISYKLVKNQSAGVVDIRIGELSHKDTGRALYVSTKAFAELAFKQNAVLDVIRKAQVDIAKVLDNKKLSKEQLIKQIRDLVIDPKASHHEESDSSSDKES